MVYDMLIALIMLIVSPLPLWLLPGLPSLDFYLSGLCSAWPDRSSTSVLQGCQLCHCERAVQENNRKLLTTP